MLRSNYYSIAKVALLEKGADFEEAVAGADGSVRLRRSRSDSNWTPLFSATEAQAEFALKSPAGKVPVLETDRGVVTETSVILEYLDETLPGPALFPADPLERARVRELMRHIELYVELPARRLYPSAFSGAPRDETEVRTVRALLERGFGSVAALARFDPFIAGDVFTAADLYAGFALPPGITVAQLIYDWDVLPQLPRLAPLLELLNQRESFARTARDSAEA
jgi:glutathione S-transferase